MASHSSRLGRRPAAGAFLAGPLRAPAGRFLLTLDGTGAPLILLAFGLLAAGLALPIRPTSFRYVPDRR